MFIFIFSCNFESKLDKKNVYYSNDLISSDLTRVFDITQTGFLFFCATQTGLPGQLAKWGMNGSVRPRLVMWTILGRCAMIRSSAMVLALALFNVNPALLSWPPKFMSSFSGFLTRSSSHYSCDCQSADFLPLRSVWAGMLQAHSDNNGTLRPQQIQWKVVIHSLFIG